MSPLPPAGHYPACILPLYILARALRETYPAVGEPTFDLSPYRVGDRTNAPPSAVVDYLGERRSFSVKVGDLSLSRTGVDLDLMMAMKPKPPQRPGPAPRRLPQPGDPPPRPPEPAPAAPEEAPPQLQQPAEPQEAPRPATITLVPPYEGCLAPERLGATARWGGLWGIPARANGGRTFPDDGYFSFPSITELLGRTLREVLATGAARASLLEVEEGERPLVPPGFWLTKAAEAVLAADVPVTIRMSAKRYATGNVWFDGVAFEPAWRAIWAHTAVTMPPAEDLRSRAGTYGAVPRPTPWMIFMQQIATELGYSGGYPYGQYDLSGEDIGFYIQHRLEEMGPSANFQGKVSPDYARAMGAFISHPLRRSGGAPPGEIGPQREAFRKKFDLDRFKRGKGNSGS